MLHARSALRARDCAAGRRVTNFSTLVQPCRLAAGWSEPRTRLPHKGTTSISVTTTDGGEPEALSDDMLHAVLAFYRLSRSLRNADLIRDLTWERLSTLSVVARREPVSISQLSLAEDVTAPTISRTVAALQNQSLVRCVANRSDGRSVLVSSTAKGRATLQKGMVRTLEQIAELLTRLDSQELEALANIIRQARESKPQP